MADTHRLSICGRKCALTLPEGLPLAGALLPFRVPQPDISDFSLDVTRTETAPGDLATDLDIASTEAGVLFRRRGLVMSADHELKTFAVAALPEECFTGQPWLMLALWAHLTLRGGALLHGGVCAIEGRFVLLLGPPDHGKSTLCGLAEQAGHTCLSDEHAFLTTEPDCLRAWACPWPGVRHPVSAMDGPLHSVFLLRHAPTHELARLSPASALRALIPLTRFFAQLSETVPTTMAVVQRMVATTPVYDFGFVPELSAVDEMRSVL
jgi:hypothetical protein